MENTYSFLKNAWLWAKEEVKNNPIFLVLLVLLSLPLPYKYNRYFCYCFSAFFILFFKRKPTFYQIVCFSCCYIRINGAFAFMDIRPKDVCQSIIQNASICGYTAYF